MNFNRSVLPFAVLGLLLACSVARGAEELSAHEVARLLARKTTAATAGTEAAAERRLLKKLDGIDRNDPEWPLYTFLRAELLLQMRSAKPAEEAYRNIVGHAASDPYKDTWGGSGIVAFALYRWLQLQAASESTDPAPFAEMSAWADRVLETRLVRSAFRPYAILSSMPLLEEQLYHALAKEALRVGNRKRAGAYFLDYLGRVRSSDVKPEADPLYRVVLDEGNSTQDRISLLIGKRLYSIGQASAALPNLEIALRSSNDQTRIEAKYLLARASGNKMSRAQKAGIFQEVQRYATSDDLTQGAMLREGLLYGRTEPEFASILGRLVSEFPRGESTEEALNWLAWGARISGDLDAASNWASKLGKLHAQSSYFGIVAIHTALALMWRAQPKDLDSAAALLEALVAEQPNARDRPRALFWLARIAQKQGNETQAKRRLQEAAEADWFGYYGLRARMHLASGPAARSQLLIENKTLANEIRAEYAGNGSNKPKGDNVYFQRIRNALDKGLYRSAIGSENALRQANPSVRVQDLTFDELDKLGFVAPVAVMMALRQDTLAAADKEPSLAGRLWLADRIGKEASDWPASLNLVHPASFRSSARASELMRAPGYLRIAYPQVFATMLREASTEFRVAPSILYAVMRHESFFYPAALSSVGALGLFQFMPGTFDDLNREWRVAPGDTAADRAAFLMNEQRSIQLGARWFGEKKLPAFNGNPLFAVLAHHSGNGRVKTWTDIWNKRGWSDDIEMMIESFRMHDFISERSESWGVEARGFARDVVTGIAIADATRLYADRPQR